MRARMGQAWLDAVLGEHVPATADERRPQRAACGRRFSVAAGPGVDVVRAAIPWLCRVANQLSRYWPRGEPSYEIGRCPAGFGVIGRVRRASPLS